MKCTTVIFHISCESFTFYISIFQMFPLNLKEPIHWNTDENFSKSCTITKIHYIDVIMSAVGSQIIGVPIDCSTVCWSADQRKHQSLTSLAFVRGIGEFPAQRTSNAENVSIWWRHHESNPFPKWSLVKIIKQTAKLAYETSLKTTEFYISRKIQLWASVKCLHGVIGFHAN